MPPELTLDTLIPPRLWSDGVFERRAAHFPRGAAPSATADVLNLSTASVYRCAASLPRSQAEIHLSLANASEPMQCFDDGEACVARARTGGATLLAGGYEYLDPLVQQFVRAWRDFFGVWGSGNVYSTPEGGQGLLYHSDSTDIFIMQLEGEKRWDVCGRLLPNLNEPHGGAVPPFAEDNVPHRLRAVVAACRPIELRPGDILYMPIGVVHRARASLGTASLHLTMSLERVGHGFAWGGFVADLITQAQQEPQSAPRLTRQFVEWLHEVAAVELELTVLPHSFHGEDRWNTLAKGDGAGDDLLAAALHKEFVERVKPILLRHARSRDDEQAAAVELSTTQQVELLETHVLGNEQVVRRAIGATRELMQRSMEIVALDEIFYPDEEKDFLSQVKRYAGGSSRRCRIAPIRPFTPHVPLFGRRRGWRWMRPTDRARIRITTASAGPRRANAPRTQTT